MLAWWFWLPCEFSGYHFHCPGATPSLQKPHKTPLVWRPTSLRTTEIFLCLLKHLWDQRGGALPYKAQVPPLWGQSSDCF